MRTDRRKLPAEARPSIPEHRVLEIAGVVILTASHTLDTMEAQVL